MSKSNSNKKTTEEVKPAKPATTFRLRFLEGKAPDRKSWLRSFGVGAAIGASVTGIVVGASVLAGASLADVISAGE